MWGRECVLGIGRKPLSPEPSSPPPGSLNCEPVCSGGRAAVSWSCFPSGLYLEPCTSCFLHPRHPVPGVLPGASPVAEWWASSKSQALSCPCSPGMRLGLQTLTNPLHPSPSLLLGSLPLCSPVLIYALPHPCPLFAMPFLLFSHTCTGTEPTHPGVAILALTRTAILASWAAR